MRKKRHPLIQPKPPWERDSSDRWFKVWFVFCAILSLAITLGMIWLIIYLLPHVVAFLDRAG